MAVYPVTDGLAVYAQDITEEKNLREQIARSQENLLALINNSDDMIALLDPELRLVLVNEAFEQSMKDIWGAGTSLKRGDSILMDSLTPDVRASWKAMFQRALQGERFQVTLPGQHLHNDILEIEFSFNPIWYQGKVIGIGWFQRDTSERRWRELQILRQNTRLRELAFTQSHDVRKYLANLMGLIMLFDREAPENPQSIGLLEHLDEVSEQLDAVIHRIVDQVHEIEKDLRDQSDQFSDYSLSNPWKLGGSSQG
jgi:nitrogen-specific signal transduction histidine kinase